MEITDVSQLLPKVNDECFNTIPQFMHRIMHKVTIYFKRSFKIILD